MAADPKVVHQKALEAKLDKILKDFETAHDTDKVTPGKNLRALLDGSPDLKARILDSIDKGHLTKFDGLPADAHAGGTYNSGTKTIELPLDKLNVANKDKAQASELVFVMGHEIQHSFNSAKSDKEVDKFVDEVNKIAKGPGPHDYTHAVKTVIEAYRKDEAEAHIGGFNALSSQVLKDNPKAGLKEIYNADPFRGQDFIDRTGKAPNFTYALKPDLTIGADMKIPATADNIKAMGKHYFDQPPAATRLGTKGNQDYPNYYGEWALGYVAQVEKQVQDAAKKADPKHVAPEVQVNMKDIGLNPALIDTKLHYTDTSPKKPVVGDASVGQVSVAEPAMFRQALDQVERIGPAAGLRSSEEARNVAAALAMEAQKNGLTEISGVVQGRNGNVIAYQGDPSSEQAKRVAVDVGAAREQPAQTSLDTMNKAQSAPAQEAPKPERAAAMGM